MESLEKEEYTNNVEARPKESKINKMIVTAGSLFVSSEISKLIDNEQK